jgi:hypothetical protein
MDLVAACPLRVGSILWQPRPGAWMLTVVCKATYVLLPVESPLAGEQDPLNETDDHWNDDERRSLQAASDLVPFNPACTCTKSASTFTTPSISTILNLRSCLVAGVGLWWVSFYWCR